MNHFLMFIFATLTLNLLGCDYRGPYAQENLEYEDFSRVYWAALARSGMIFFEKEIIIPNNSEPYRYSQELKKIFNQQDVNTKYGLSTLFEALYLCDSKAAGEGLFIEEANFTKNMAKVLCTKLDLKLYRITHLIPKNFTYVHGNVIRINGKNFCKRAFDPQMNELALTESITDDDIVSYFKDFLNPLAHKDIFIKTWSKSNKKIETLLLCFKRLKTKEIVTMPKCLIMHHFIPEILKERFEDTFKKTNAAFIDAIGELNKEQKMAYAVVPLHSCIQQYFFSGESIKSFNEGARKAFANFLKDTK